jgi:hypothetical protein
MRQTFDVAKFKQARDEAKRYFEVQKTGDQSLYIDQTKLFQPLIDTTKETSKAIQERIGTDHKELENALVPFTAQLRRRNEQVEALQNLPFHTQEIEPVGQSTPKKNEDVLKYNLDKILNETDNENLQDMSLELPSKVMGNENFEQVLSAVERLNRRYGQFTGKASTKDQKEQEIYKSRMNTLEKYKQSLLEQKPTLKYKMKKGESRVKLKRGRGRPRSCPVTILYSSVDELVKKLEEYVSAKYAGNTGLDEIIISILDELLEKNHIDKKMYNKMYKNIFPII